MRRILKRGAAALALAIAGGALWALAEHCKQDSALAHAELPFYASADLRPRWDWLSRGSRVGQFALRDQRDQPLDQSLLEQGPKHDLARL